MLPVASGEAAAVELVNEGGVCGRCARERSRNENATDPVELVDSEYCNGWEKCGSEEEAESEDEGSCTVNIGEEKPAKARGEVQVEAGPGARECESACEREANDSVGRETLRAEASRFRRTVDGSLPSSLAKVCTPWVCMLAAGACKVGETGVSMYMATSRSSAAERARVKT